MTQTQLAYRRPPGPEEPISLGVDPATLATLQELQVRFGDMVRINRPDGRLAYFVNDAAAVRRLLTRR